MGEFRKNLCPRPAGADSDPPGRRWEDLGPAVAIRRVFFYAAIFYAAPPITGGSGRGRREVLCKVRQTGRESPDAHRAPKLFVQVVAMFLGNSQLHEAVRASASTLLRTSAFIGRKSSSELSASKPSRLRRRRAMRPRLRCGTSQTFRAIHSAKGMPLAADGPLSYCIRSVP